MSTRLGVVAASCLCFWAAARPTIAHEHTARRFQEARAIAAAATAQQAEPAPRVGTGERFCRLTIELTLVGAEPPLAGLVRVTNLVTGKWLSFEDHIARDSNWYVIRNGATLVVPPTTLRIEAFHGLTTELAVREVNLTGRDASSLGIRLTRFYDPAARGLRSGNTHLHLMRLTRAEAVRYLELVPQADDLDLVFLSYLERKPDDRDYISNSFTEADLDRLSRKGVLFGNGEEHRHNFGPGGEGFGHVLFLDIRRLIQPVSIGPGIMKAGTDGIPLQRGIRKARSAGSTVIWCHNRFGHEDLPNWVAGLLHAQNIFDGGSEGEYSDTYYRYLDVGMRVPFSTGTDWFIYDFARVYVPLEGRTTARRWLQTLARGQSYITNGVFLELHADGRGIGDTIAVAEGQRVRITGRALGRRDFRQLELVYNGRVVDTGRAVAEGGHFSATLDRDLQVTEPGWLALRVPKDAGTSELGKPLFAHTSPIFIELAGRRRFVADVARGMIAEMRTSLESIQGKAVFASAAEREAVARVYREAIAALQARIDKGDGSLVEEAPRSGDSRKAPRPLVAVATLGLLLALGRRQRTRTREVSQRNTSGPRSRSD